MADKFMFLPNNDPFYRLKLVVEKKVILKKNNKCQVKIYRKGTFYGKNSLSQMIKNCLI